MQQFLVSKYSYTTIVYKVDPQELLDLPRDQPLKQ